MPINVSNFASCVHETLAKIFIMGGNGNYGVRESTVLEYEIEVDFWTVLDVKLPKPAEKLGCVVIRDRDSALDGKILVFGKELSSTMLFDCEKQSFEENFAAKMPNNAKGFPNQPKLINGKFVFINDEAGQIFRFNFNNKS